MRKLAALVVLGAGCAIGFPCLAVAADVVSIDCLSGNQGIYASRASAGVELPSSCTPNSPSSEQCEADLLSQGLRWEVRRFLLEMALSSMISRG
jgi:hypothetical protein